MFKIEYENDNGLNVGREENRWCARLTFDDYEVFRTEMIFKNQSEAHGELMSHVTTKLRQMFRYTESAKKNGPLFGGSTDTAKENVKGT